MANDILEHEARARQSHSKIPEILDDKSPNSVVFDDIFQAMTFSLTFTSPQWCLFWRLLNIGCMLADQLLDLTSNVSNKAEPEAALLWNQLSAELAALLQENGVQQQQESS